MVVYLSNINTAIWTGLSRSLDDIGNETMSKTSNVWKSLDQGAATMMVAAFDPALSGMINHSTALWTIPRGIISVANIEMLEVVFNPSDIYLSDCQLAQPAPHVLKDETAERLFHLSEELVGMKFYL